MACVETFVESINHLSRGLAQHLDWAGGWAHLLGALRLRARRCRQQGDQSRQDCQARLVHARPMCMCYLTGSLQEWQSLESAPTLSELDREEHTSELQS